MSALEKRLTANAVRQEDRIWGAVTAADDELAHAERAAQSAAARGAKAALLCEQQAALAARAQARARARRASIEAPRESRPPWEWLPAPPAGAAAASADALLAALQASLLRRRGLSGAQHHVGELGSMPLLRRLRQGECAAQLQEGVREARALGNLEREDRAAYAAAERARHFALLEEEIRAREEAATTRAAQRADAQEEVRMGRGRARAGARARAPARLPANPQTRRALHPPAHTRTRTHNGQIEAKALRAQWMRSADAAALRRADAEAAAIMGGRRAAPAGSPLKAVQAGQREQMAEHEAEAAELAAQRRGADGAQLALSRACAAGWPA
jgi:hypothetical protein